MNATRVQVVLAPGVEQMVKDVSVLMFGADAANEPVPELIAQLLPLLLENALGGDVPKVTAMGSVELQPPYEDNEESIAAAIASAEEAITTPQVTVPLEINEQEPVPETPKQEMSIEDMRKAQVHPGAIQWAEGNPLREQALRETLEGLPKTAWEWERVLPLAERTYEMKYSLGD